MKTCTRCKQPKPRTEFYVRRKNPDGLREWCKVCCGGQNKGYYAANTAKVKSAIETYRFENRIAVAATKIAWQRNNQERHRLSWLRAALKKHGLTMEDYERMLEVQGGVCGGCGRSPQENKRGERLCIDHKHVAGWDQMSPSERREYVRGLLCHVCNTTAGKYEDNTLKLRRLAGYLEQPPAQRRVA